MQKNRMILDESVKMDSKGDRIKMDDWGITLNSDFFLGHLEISTL